MLGSIYVGSAALVGKRAEHDGCGGTTYLLLSSTLGGLIPVTTTLVWAGQRILGTL